MRIQKSLVDLILKQVRVEYNGTHNPDPKNPLWGRAAYWRLYIGDSYVCKVTTPVKSIKPKQSTLDRLLKAELQHRLESITESLEADPYTQVVIVRYDPYGVRRLLDLVVGQFYDLKMREVS